MIVRESISFKRGQDSKDAMGIGRKNLMKDIKYLTKFMAEDIDMIEEVLHISEGSRDDVFIVSLVLNENKKSNLTISIYNWLKREAPFWTLKEISDISPHGTGGWWVVVILEKI